MISFVPLLFLEFSPGKWRVFAVVLGGVGTVLPIFNSGRREGGGPRGIKKNFFLLFTPLSQLEEEEVFD